MFADDIDREMLASLAAKARSLSHMLRLMGVTHASTSKWYALKSRLASLGIDTTHFLGKAANSGEYHIGGPERLTQERIANEQKRFPRHVLKRFLDAAGIIEACQNCGISTWMERSLTLPIDHIDGNPRNNDIRNLRYLCPNCHSQTETFGFKKKHTEESRARMSRDKRGRSPIQAEASVREAE